MDKIDLTKDHKKYYSAATRPELIQIEKADFFSICGKGDPSGKAFAERLEALYSVIYTTKFAWKAKSKDFVVSKLEGLWWFDETKYSGKSITNSSVDVPRSEWEYRLLIRVPDFVTVEDLRSAIKAVVAKKNIELARNVEYFTMTEGLCVQMLHIGPYSTEPETLKEIGKFMDDKSLSRNGVHHEIYLSDFRKTKPEKLKTILREPAKEVNGNR